MSIEINISHITDLLQTGTGRRHIDSVMEMINKNTALFTQLVQVATANMEPESRKALWIIDAFSERHPEYLTESILTSFIDQLPEACHTALHRHILRMLARSEIPGCRKGFLMAQCFDFLLHSSEPVAVKVHAMDILFRISRSEPDIRQELISILELRMDVEAPGFINKARKILHSIHTSGNP